MQVNKSHLELKKNTHPARKRVQENLGHLANHYDVFQYSQINHIFGYILNVRSKHLVKFHAVLNHHSHVLT